MVDLAEHGLVAVAEVAPLLARAGRGIPVGSVSGVCAFALVDADDYEACLAYRWHLSRDGYVVTNVSRGSGRRTTMRLSRWLMALEFGDRRQVDHINLDPLDNRRVNLRIATNAQNCQNRKGGRGSSVYRGVTWQKDAGKWKAQANLAGQHYYFGLFDSELDAAKAAADFRAAHMPFTTN